MAPGPDAQAGPTTSDAKKKNSILAWLSRNVCIGMREEWTTRIRIQKEIQAAIESHEEEKQQLRETAMELPEPSIRRHEDAAAQRLRSIEDKARANLLSVTIAVVVLFASLDLLTGGIGVTIAGWLQVVVALGVIASVLYFLLGGWMALKALEVARVFVPRLEDEAEMDDTERATQALWNLKQNEKTIFLRTNALSASSYGVRNGVFSLIVLVGVLAGCIIVASLGWPIANPLDGLAPYGQVETLRPADSVSSDSNPSPDPGENVPSVEVDSTVLPGLVFMGTMREPPTKSVYFWSLLSTPTDDQRTLTKVATGGYGGSRGRALTVVASTTTASRPVNRD